MRMRTVCVEAEQNNAKLNSWTWLNRLVIIRGHENFLEEGKFIAGGASVASVIVSQRCPILIVFGNTVAGCWFFQIATSMFSIILQLNLYSKFGIEQPSSSVPPFVVCFLECMSVC